MNRFDMARTCQSGASNRGRVARALSEAITECHEKGIDPDFDHAVFLILHQLTFLLTGHDFCLGSDHMQQRWDTAMKDLPL